MKIQGYIGLPASGKSTIVRGLKKQHKCTIAGKHKTFRYHTNEAGDVVIAGIYDMGDTFVFEGTDRLSMSVLPEAIEFLKANKNIRLFIWEGDRFTNYKFFKYVYRNHDAVTYLVHVDDVVRMERMSLRGSKPMNKTWEKAYRTRIEKIVQKFPVRLHRDG